VKKLPNPELRNYLNIFSNKHNIGDLKLMKNIISQRNALATDFKDK